MSTVYKPRRTAGSATVFLVVFGLFIPIGIAVWLFAEPAAGIGITAFGVFVVLIMVLQIAAVGAKYSIGPEGLSLKRGSARITYGPDMIAGARIISQGEVDRILKSFTGQVMESEQALDLKGWLSSNVAYGRFTRFCTVPIVQSKATAGSPLNVVSFGAHTTGRFVLLKTSDGEHLLLSPQDADGFFRMLSSTVSLRDPVSEPEGGWAGRVTPEVEGRRKRTKKAYIVYAALSALLIFGALGYFYDDITAPEPEPYTVTPDPESGWVGTDAFRVIIETPPEPMDLYPEREERKQQIIHKFDETYYFDVTAALMAWYFDEYDVWPLGKEREDVHAAIMKLVGNLEAELLKADFDDDMTMLTAWVEVRDDNLEPQVISAVEEVIGKSD